MHKVEYSGLYCRRAICGDWKLKDTAVAFWIWPESEMESQQADEDVEVDEPVMTELGREASRTARGR
jgi:hypothetical protein